MDANSRLRVHLLKGIKFRFVLKGSENDQIFNASRRFGETVFAVIVMLASLCNVLLSNEEIKKRFAYVISVLHTLPSPGRGRPRLITAFQSLQSCLFLFLIEYLLAYLFLITDSRLSLPYTHIHDSHSHC